MLRFLYLLTRSESLSIRYIDMQSNLKIRLLAPFEWEKYLALRRLISEYEPKTAYYLPQEEALFNNNRWYGELLKYQSEDREFFYVAEIDCECVGMIGGSFDVGIKFKHNFFLGPLYVLPQYRQMKVATELYNFLIDKIVTNNDLRKIYLTVFEGNNIAYHWYKKLGFKESGKLHKNMYFQGEFYDKIFMEKFV